VQPGVVMLDGMKNKRIGPDEVMEKFGVPPDKVIDVQALAGDSVDNVPGVPGIGVKTAAQLITEYGDLDGLLERAGEIKQPKRREKLIEFADQARVSRDLVTLAQDAPLKVSPEHLAVQEPAAASLLGFLRDMEFNTLTRRIAEALGAEPPPAPAVSVGATVAKGGQAATTAGKAASKDAGERAEAGTPAAGVAHGRNLATWFPLTAPPTRP
jgi:DNA polymerase-1